MEWLLGVAVVIAGWLVVQMVRARTPGTAPPPASTSLPKGFVTHPPGLVGARVPVTHPIVRHAADRAARQGNRFVQRDGDALYFVLDGIEDPEERRRAYDILSRSLSDDPANDDEPDMQDVLWVAQLLGRG